MQYLWSCQLILCGTAMTVISLKMRWSRPTLANYSHSIHSKKYQWIIYNWPCRLVLSNGFAFQIQSGHHIKCYTMLSIVLTTKTEWNTKFLSNSSYVISCGNSSEFKLYKISPNRVQIKRLPLDKPTHNYILNSGWKFQKSWSLSTFPI